MIVGADLYLNSVWDAWRAKNQELFRNAPASDATSDDASTNGKMFDEIRASGGYFRNSYNSDDVMWAMGLSWPDTVGVLLDSEGYLAVERTRELLAMIAARPLTKERLTQHYFDYIIHGIEQHPITGWLFQSLGGLPTVPPDFDNLAVLLRRRRKELIAILKKSIALNEPLLCSV
jgi:hypothetical protein